MSIAPARSLFAIAVATLSFAASASQASAQDAPYLKIVSPSQGTLTPFPSKPQTITVKIKTNVRLDTVTFHYLKAPGVWEIETYANTPYTYDPVEKVWKVTIAVAPKTGYSQYRIYAYAYEDDTNPELAEFAEIEFQ